MKKYTLIIVLMLLCVWSSLRAQMVGTNVFLQGRYLEVGMRTNGAFGAPSAPAGYHPHTGSSSSTHLASVYDYGHDGWTVGSPPFMGDYTYVGSPHEGWGIQANVGRTHAFESGSFVHGSGGSLTGAITGYSNSAGTAKAIWSGTAAAGSLVVTKEIVVDTNASAVVVNVKLKNTSAAAIPGIYYLRTCDPDIDQTWPGGLFATDNKVVYQNDSANRVLVQAKAGGAVPGGIPFCLGARDNRAKAFIYNSWAVSTAVDFADIYNQTVPAIYGAYYYDLANQPGDIAIGIIFNLGTLAGGDSTTFKYSYIYNGASAIDSTLIPPCSGMPVAGLVNANSPVACASTPLILNVVGYSFATGISFQWQSSPDSATWTNISGATSVSYSFSGLTTSTFYRCKVICTHSGLTAFTPGFRVSYLAACPCLHTAGFMVPGPATACSTSVITLNTSGYTTGAGIALQWQTSADSVSWSDIAGATSVPYTFTGISATTFYRLKATCIATGLSVFSPVRKVAYSPTCSCATIATLLGGTATASTGMCSSCVLTLGLSGASSAYDINYQWQRSTSTSSTWSNIPGAINSIYTHSPTLPYFYRCKISCSGSGTTVYSTPVFVNVAAIILDDSVMQFTDTACSGQLFFIKASNNSPLLTVKTYFGDGLTLLSSLVVSGTFSYVNVGHAYAAPGHYSVKQVLYSDGVPMDSVLFTYLHRECNLFLLKFYSDGNGNCSKDAFETYSHNPFSVRVDSNGIPVDTLTVTGGVYYKARGPVGTIYAFTALSAYASIVCPSSGVIYDTIGTVSGLTRIRHFGFICTATAFDVAEYVTMQCGRHMATAKVLVANKICSETSATIQTSVSPKYIYVGSGVLSGVNISSGPFVAAPDLSWSTYPLSVASHNPLFTVNFRVPGAYLTIGDTVHSKYVAMPIIDDENPTNNVIIRVDTVKASYDPNMIEVFPPGCFDADTVLQYIVHFENKGNDTAHNVHVLDTLSPNLDASTFEMLATSANMNVYKYQDAGHTIIKFDFPNIKLLDSSWQGLNDGMFVFKIRTRPGLMYTSTIHNRVGIYFDENEVVMTNTVVNTKGCPSVPVNTGDLAPGPMLLIYPNPVFGELTIQSEKDVFNSFTISNAVGQEILKREMNGSKSTCDVSALPTGIYFVTLRGEGASEVRKFVKR